MDLPLFVKLLAGVAAVVGAGKVLYEITTGKKTRLRDEYNFAKDFLSDVEQNKLHPFAIQKGYQAVAGTTLVSSAEVAYILSLKDPAQCLNDFVLSKNYLEHLETQGNLELHFKKKYKSKWAKFWRKNAYLASYVILAFLALSPVVLSEFIEATPAKLLTMLAISIPFFGLYAWASLRAFARIYRGQKLVENQEKHTQNIVIKT